eukprot:14559539-Alexandrium_andersonii.AAC.1
MSASLVGSEMCIRDSACAPHGTSSPVLGGVRCWPPSDRPSGCFLFVVGWPFHDGRLRGGLAINEGLLPV